MRQRITILLTLVLTLTACSSDDERSQRERLVEMDVVASIDHRHTRAAETAWEEGDKIGVYITNTGTQTINTETTEGANLEYTFDDGTKYETNGNTYRLFSPSAKKFYLSSTLVDVYGYYPYSERRSNGIDAMVPTAVEVDVSDQSDQSAIDLMRACTPSINNNKASVELLFEHRMTKLVFNLKQSDAMLDDELDNATFLGVKLDNQPLAATYNIYQDVFLIPSNASVITAVEMEMPALGYDKSFEAIVFPNYTTQNAPTDRTVTVTYNHGDDDVVINTFTIDSDVSFKSGYKYTFNVTFNATSVVVDADDKYTVQW